jgi:hypothetical protein
MTTPDEIKDETLKDILMISAVGIILFVVSQMI